jgi:Leucine-rich repeat (LRR) protein
MGLTKVPSELFRMKNVKTLYLLNNNLCSLPSEIAHLSMLDTLIVRLPKRSDRDLTKDHKFRSASTSSRLFRPNSVCWPISCRSLCDNRGRWILI